MKKANSWQKTPSNTDSYHQELMALHKLFAKSKWGRTLASQTRFAMYQPQHISNQQWIGMFGPDVNNLEHLIFTYENAVAFTNSLAKTAKNMGLDSSGRKLLLVTAITHDWAEAVIGDINFNLKTQDHLDAEMTALKEICKEMGVPSRLALKIERILRREESELGLLFNVIERIGYIGTALTAYEWAHKSDDDPVLKAGLEAMYRSVAKADMPTMLGYAEQFSYIYDLLQRRKASVIGMCASSADATALESELRKLGFV